MSRYDVTFPPLPPRGEENSGELIVVPDQSYSIPVLLDKFTRGLMPPVLRHGDYDEDQNEAFDVDSDVFTPDDRSDVVNEMRDIQERINTSRRSSQTKSTVESRSDTPQTSPEDSKE